MTTSRTTINWLMSLALITSSAMLAAQQGGNEPAEEKELRQQIQEAHAQLAEAARRMARLQREFGAASGDREIIHFRPDEAPGDKDVSIRLDDAHWFDSGHANVMLENMPPRLGVLLGGPDSNTANEVVGLTPGGGAGAAGIARGDRLVSVNGDPVAEGAPDSVRKALEGIDSGDTVPVVVERDGERLQFDVETNSMIHDVRVLTMRPESGEFEREIVIMRPDGPGLEGAPRPPMPPRLPLFEALGHDSDLISNHAGLEPYFGTDEGVVVLRVDPENELGLRDGDVVLRLDEETVNRPVDLGRLLLSRKPGEQVVLEVMRKGVLAQMPATIPERSETRHRFPMKIKIEKSRKTPNAPTPPQTL